MKFGSLFAGIGGMDLGLERAGMTCQWQVEIDPFCRRVLAKHWPDVRRHDDVRTFPPDDGTDWGVDLIAGGFPCQDASTANARGTGIDGEKTGLWREFSRIIRTLRPGLVLMENVPGLLGRGFGRVLGDLAESGYDAEWQCIPASAFDARHQRERLFIVAYPRCVTRESRGRDGDMACAKGGSEGQKDQRQRNENAVVDRGPTLADATSDGRTPGGAEFRSHCKGMGEVDEATARPMLDPWIRRTRLSQAIPQSRGAGLEGPRFFRTTADRAAWLPEPDMGRVVDGIPDAMDKARLRGLGNAVVPQVAEWIGRRILTMTESNA